VNFSARQFEHPNLTGLISSILRETEVEPRWLEVEITETTAMRDVKHTQETLRKLRAMGVRAFLDDFGTGHASLNYLKDFPLHSLKIDRSFVADLEVDEQNRAITTAIVGLGQALKLHVVAEGVETAGQLEFLQSRECDAYQGYLFSKALPPEEFAEIVQGEAHETVALAG
jgi:EAL domain-containing protein (putative c-di-GMP-specific phosphodiesterase class I)